ncbi:SRPBCC family protein [Streptomyces sp. NPDC001985]|uniref:SRPBCC family protein n=1 Tax=Streptomyces sp. NPDC001985 TaxID=3154406 RepID=UPI003325A782
MNRSHYRFRSVWELTAPPGAVFTALARAEEYPLWWPQIREATRLGPDRGTVRVRSFLPYELRVTVGTLRHDPAARVLEARLTGDMEGWARWTLTPHHAGTRAVYEQEVEVRRPLLRRLGPLCRPVFRANHAVMMRAGRRGLEAWVGGFGAGGGGTVWFSAFPGD